MSAKPNNVIRIPSNFNENFFKYWLKFLQPFHNLTEQEMSIGAAFLRERQKLSKVVLDEDVLDRALMDEEIQKKIRGEFSITNQHFQVMKNKLKNKNFFIENKINPKLIPNVKDTDGVFQLLLLFDLKA